MNLKNRLIDSHCHLTGKRIKKNMSKIIESLDDFYFIVNNATNIDDIKDVIEQSKLDDKIKFCLGVYPSYAEQWDYDYVNILFNERDNKNFIAIGECGLDYSYDNISKELQKEVFIEQLEIANKLEKSIVIHTRQAEDDVIIILKETNYNVNKLLHCFYPRNQEDIDFINNNDDIYISINGYITVNDAVLENILKVNKEKILFETDSPYLTPLRLRSEEKFNTPKNVLEIYKVMSEAWNIDIDETIELVLNNNKRFYLYE